MYKKKTVKKEVRTNKNKRFSRLRGMKDVLQEEYRYLKLVKKKASQLATTYGFKRIEVPILERTKMYENSTGKDTILVSKELYSFQDKNGDKVSLRPEATPGLVRAFIEHNMIDQPQPVKLCFLGPVFRQEKPQASHLCQHTQFDLEIFGEASPVADAQLILVAFNFFKELQVEVQVQINSIGCKECRPEYIKKLVEFYKERGKRTKLCNECKKNFQKNPLKLLDCKEEDCIAVREDAPQTVDYLCEDCRDHFIKVLEYLDELEIPYNLDSFLVRGLDYYNRTVFEIIEADQEDDVNNKKYLALCGGGRFNALVEKMGGKTTPAAGFALGLERVIKLIKEKNIPLQKEDYALIFIAQLGDQSRRKAFSLFEEMRRAGYRVRQSFTLDSLKAQLEEGERLGARFTLILGQKELLDGTIIIRDMESGTQEVIDYKKIYPELSKRLEEKKE